VPPAVEIVVIPGAEHELTLPDGTLAREDETKLAVWLRAVART
jgi:hypothetical protein